MTTIINTTATPVVVPMSGRSLAASCVLGAGHRSAGIGDLRVNGLGLNGSAAAESVLTAGTVLVAEAFLAVERPTQAPVAGMTWRYDSAFVASGAGHQTKPVTSVSIKQIHRTKRAFRGLEPWRDPA